MSLLNDDESNDKIMACIVLLGGIPAVGKTEFFRLMKREKKTLFKPIETQDIEGNFLLTYPRVHRLIFDRICPREEQAKMGKNYKTFRNFRYKLLTAAERYICQSCEIECQLQGPLMPKSLELVEILKRENRARFVTPFRKTEKIVFLVEDNFYYWSMRYEWYQIAKRGGLGFCQLYLTCPLEVAVARNETRFCSIPKELITNMYRLQELPDPEKRKFEKLSLLLDIGEELKYEQMYPVIELIETALKCPIERILDENKLEAQIIASKSVVHQADKVLRKITGQLIKESKENNPKQSADVITNILSCRHELLTNLKQGNVELPEHITSAITTSGTSSENIALELESVLEKLLKEQCHITNVGAN